MALSVSTVRNHFGLGFFFHHFAGFNGEIACRVSDVAERCANRDGRAYIGQGAGQITGLEHFHVHDGLVGFDSRHDVAAFNFVARLFFPGNDHTLGHCVRELGHGNGVVLGHG